MSFDLNKYEKAVGPLFACQLSLQLFIEDTTNDIIQRNYAETIYEWLGTVETTIDELCEVSYEKSLFIFEVLKNYMKTNIDLNIIFYYGDAIGSLQYQIDYRKNKILKKF
jgi:hypothetical protein